MSKAASTVLMAEKPDSLRRALKRGLLWLLLLAPFFFLSYNLANQHAARLDATGGVGSLVFGWESAIPLWPWTIIPYWSIDFLYGFAFLCCVDKTATNRLGLRLLTAQLVCVGAFFLFPLRFTFERPEIGGLSGALFNALTRFDLPYNQAPSLHIALLVIIWRQFSSFAARAPAAPRYFIHFWAFLIALSVLTTWQHHFIDLPTGFAAGLFCLWLWPDAGKSPLCQGRTRKPALALYYLAGALLCLAVALWLQGAWLILSWLSLSLLLVAFNYAWAGVSGFQKQGGRHALAAKWLFAPYILGAWINSRLWTWKSPSPSAIGDGIWLGRLPTSSEFAKWAKGRGEKPVLFDLTAELPAPELPAGASYSTMPCLDLAPIPAAKEPGGDLLEAVRRLSALKKADPGREIWVACALGMSRSASVVVAWLCASKEKPADLQEAVEKVCAAYPYLALKEEHIANLQEFRKGLFCHDKR